MSYVRQTITLTAHTHPHITRHDLARSIDHIARCSRQRVLETMPLTAPKWQHKLLSQWPFVDVRLAGIVSCDTTHRCRWDTLYDNILTLLNESSCPLISDNAQGMTITGVLDTTDFALTVTIESSCLTTV